MEATSTSTDIVAESPSTTPAPPPDSPRCDGADAASSSCEQAALTVAAPDTPARPPAIGRDHAPSRGSSPAPASALAAPSRSPALTPAAAAALNAPTRSGFRHAKTVLAYSEKGGKGGAPRESVTVFSTTTARTSMVTSGPPVLRYRTDLDKPVLHFVFERLGRPVEEIHIPFKDEDERDANTSLGDWHFFWMSVSRVRNVLSGSAFRANDYQIVNHFPNHYELTRKDLMYRNIKRYLRENSGTVQAKKLSLLTAADWVAAAANGAAAANQPASGSVSYSASGVHVNGTGLPSGLSSGGTPNPGRQTVFHFAEGVPITYNIPADMSMVMEEFKRHPGATWIVKPTSRSQGKGIFLINRIQQLTRWVREKREIDDDTDGRPVLGGGGPTGAAAGVVAGPSTSAPAPAAVGNGTTSTAGGAAAPFRVSGPAPNAPTVAAQAGSPAANPNSTAAAAVERQRQEHLTSLMGTFIVSKYIANPLLIGGKKFDMRLYVLVTSYKPLVAYLHEAGFARFCATKYAGNSLAEDDLGSHLTNVALQKTDEHYNTTHGGKWSLKNLFLYLQGRHGPYVAEGLMTNIEFLIYHSLKAMEAVMFNDKHSFELYGYDILVDENIKPHLIEVNASPSLSTTTTSDRLLKEEVLADTLRIVLPPGYPSPRAPTYYEYRTRTDLTTQLRTGFRLLQFP